MKTADEKLMKCLTEEERPYSLKVELYNILDRYVDNEGHQSVRENSKRMVKEIDRLMDTVEQHGY